MCDVQISPMIDKLTSRLSASQKPSRPTSSQSVGDDDVEELQQKDELEIIDDIVAMSRRHPLAELPPPPHALSLTQVSFD